MTDNISLINRALLGIGARAQVSSLTDGSTEANAAAILYQPTFEQLARTANWNCLRRQNTLTLLKAAQGTPENPLGTTLPLPSQPWLYEYLYPTDCLRLQYILPTFSTINSASSPFTSAPTMYPAGRGQAPFSVNYDVDSSGNPLNGILTNVSAAQAVYTANQPNPSNWDSHFQAAFVAALGAFFVPALSLHMPLMNVMSNMAEKAIAAARTSDGNEGDTCQDNLPDFIRARGTTRGAYGNYNGYGAAFGEMAWPSAF